MWIRMITDELTRFRRSFFFFRKRKGKREEKKKEGSKLLILIYTRLDMILDRRRRVKIRDANEQTCCWTKYREYIYILWFPANTFWRAYVEDRQTLGNSMIREYVSCHHWGWTTSFVFTRTMSSACWQRSWDASFPCSLEPSDCPTCPRCPVSQPAACTDRT